MSATGELGEPGVADAVAAAAGVSDADGVAAAAGVSDSDGEADAAKVSDSEGEADEAGDDPDELVVVVADGDASGVGVAIACGVRADTLRITTAATVHHGPNLKPAGILEATWHPVRPHKGAMDIAPDFDFIVIPLPVWTFHGSKASHPAVGLMNGVGDEVPFGVESTGSYGGGLLSRSAAAVCVRCTAE